MSDQHPMSDDDEQWKTYVGNRLRGQDERLERLDVNVKRLLAIVEKGSTFFTFCRWFGIAVKWVAGVAAALIIIVKAWQTLTGHDPSPTPPTLPPGVP